MKKILILLTTLFFVTTLFAQDFELIPFRVKNKWGFSDANKKMKIKAKFDGAIPFNYGYAAFKKNNQWGFINIKGDIIVKARYDSISGYFQKYTIGRNNDSPIYKTGIKVYLNNETYFVDEAGTKFKNKPETIEIAWDDDSAEDYIEVFEKDGKYGFINTENDLMKEAFYNSVIISNIGIITYIEISKTYEIFELETLKSLIVGQFKSIEPTPDEFGFYVTYETGQMNYFDKKGRKTFPEPYNEIIKLPYSNSEFMLRKGKMLFAYLDLSKNPIKVIQPKYLKIDRFKNGYAKVKTKNGKVGYIAYDETEYFIK